MLHVRGHRGGSAAVWSCRQECCDARRVRETEFPERALAPPAADGSPRRTPRRGGLPGEADRGGPSGGPMQDDWGRRGVSVSLGRGRPRRSAEKGHRGLSAMFLRAWSGPQAASSVHLSTEVPAGPLQEAGYECHSVSEFDGGGPRDHRGSLSARRLEMRAAADGEGPLRGRPCVGRPPCAPRYAVVHISGLGKVPDWLGREFQRMGPGRSPGAPGLRVRPPGRRGALGRLSCPTERHFPRTPDGPGAPRFSGGSPLSGEGERSPTRSEGLRPAPAPRQAPLSGPRRPDFHTLPLAAVGRGLGREFQRRPGGRGPRTPWARGGPGTWGYDGDPEARGSTEALGRPRLGAASLGTVTGYPMVPVGDWFGREFHRRPEAGDPSSYWAVGTWKNFNVFSQRAPGQGVRRGAGPPQVRCTGPGHSPQPPHGTSWRLARERISREGGREGARGLPGCGDLVKFSTFFQKDPGFWTHSPPRAEPQPRGLSPGYPMAPVGLSTSGGTSRRGEGRRAQQCLGCGT